ncbi:signal peptidase II [Mycoplasma sp. SG1]|uniref:signal peptidase II n=1 Tax=Mycoplasma sp. SG1 TaxID=2810348 RepID=UPI0020255609|nr:signal peptidase II [Mycoplasma sp. SG1]URM53176.1 signal peptidase II [Mycoplasma sp. SG1]
MSTPINKKFSSFKGKIESYFFSYWTYLKKEYLCFIFLSIFLLFGLIIDQVLKSLIFHNHQPGWQGHQNRTGFWAFFDFGFALNQGLAGGILWNFSTPVYVILFIIIIGFFLAFIFTKDFTHKLSCGMIFVGGFSNLLDRFQYHGVVDYLQLFNLHAGYFNIADCFVIAGLGYFLIILIFDLVISKESEPIK